MKSTLVTSKILRVPSSASKWSAGLATTALATAALLQSKVTCQIDWVLLNPATSPPARGGHAGLTFDSGRNVVVVFGGSNSNGADHGDTWEWNGTSWLQALPASSPPARRGTAMHFDSVRGRTLLFGGSNASGYLSDVWEWSGATWTQRVPVGARPSARNYHAMAFDSARGVMVMHGGWNGAQAFDETWEWNGAGWSLRVLSANTLRLQNHGMAYDTARGCMVIFGGWNPNGYRSDTWEWDGGNQGWRLVATPVRPAARRGHIMVYDAARGRTTVCGGHLTNQILNGETWDWDGQQWIQRFPVAAPPPHVVAAAAYDHARRAIVMLDGGAGTWRCRPTMPAQFQSLGVGCAGAAGTPILRARPEQWPHSLPWLGSTFSGTFENLGSSPPNVPFLTLGVSTGTWAGTPLPMSLAPFGMHGCTLYVEPLVNISLANNGGQASWSLVLPSSSGLLGVNLYAQGFVLNNATSPPQASASGYCQLTVGSR